MRTSAYNYIRITSERNFLFSTAPFHAIYNILDISFLTKSELRSKTILHFSNRFSKIGRIYRRLCKATNIMRIVRTTIMIAIASPGNSSRQIENWLGSTKSRHPNSRVRSVWNIRKNALTDITLIRKHIASAETRLPAECTELLLPNNRFLISPPQSPKVSESVDSSSLPAPQALCSLLISRRYYVPLFQQFCPRRIAGIIDKTSKSVARAPNKIDLPSCFHRPGCVRE